MHCDISPHHCVSHIFHKIVRKRCIMLRSVHKASILSEWPFLCTCFEITARLSPFNTGSVCFTHTVVPCVKASWSTTHTQAVKQPYYPQPPDAVTMTTGWLGDTALSQRLRLVLSSFQNRPQKLFKSASFSI